MRRYDAKNWTPEKDGSYEVWYNPEGGQYLDRLTACSWSEVLVYIHDARVIAVDSPEILYMLDDDGMILARVRLSEAA